MKFVSLCTFLVLITGCARYESARERLENWAKPYEVGGVKNFYRVSPDLYRSEQPTMIGMKNLENRGIKTIVSLRAFHSDRSLIEGTSLNYERITFQTWYPENDELIRFLKSATDPTKTPALVHCLHGSDRTGAMCAAYRVVVQGWSKQAAIEEMKKGGFGHHKIWRNLEKWIRELDVDEISRKVK